MPKAKTRSRLQPQHPNWKEDLPERNAPPRERRWLHGDLRSLGERELEVSRAGLYQRGGGILFGIFLGCLVCSMIGVAILMFIGSFSNPRGEPVLTGVFLVLGVVSLVAPASLLRSDLKIPRDTPVRFDRHRGKVHVYEFEHSWNPYKKWPTVIKTFDWDNLHAQIVEFRGFSGKAYIVRYSLLLSSCRPGTLEVVDSFTLKGNIEGGNRYQLGETWAYCRHFMEKGLDDLPECKRTPPDVSFRRNFFYYMNFLDPTQEGREVRESMGVAVWLILVPLTLLMSWMLFPLGICRYIAMKLAPDPVWPVDLDAPSDAECPNGQPAVRML